MKSSNQRGNLTDVSVCVCRTDRPTDFFFYDRKFVMASIAVYRVPYEKSKAYLPSYPRGCNRIQKLSIIEILFMKLKDRQTNIVTYESEVSHGAGMKKGIYSTLSACLRFPDEAQQ